MFVDEMLFISNSRSSGTLEANVCGEVEDQKGRNKKLTIPSEL